MKDDQNQIQPDQSADRRARVLAYPDLAAKLTQPPLNYSRPDQWNGWIPPRIINPGGNGELLRSPGGRGNQLGHREPGETVNDSSRRAALVDIAAEAWQRDQDNRQEGSP